MRHRDTPQARQVGNAVGFALRLYVAFTRDGAGDQRDEMARVILPLAKQRRLDEADRQLTRIMGPGWTPSITEFANAAANPLELIAQAAAARGVDPNTLFERQR